MRGTYIFTLSNAELKDKIIWKKRGNESFYKTEEAYFVDVSCTDSKVNTGDNENWTQT